MTDRDLVYLDNAATTRLDEAVLAAMMPYLRDEFGNPSALHALGVRARGAVEEARERLRAAVGSRPSRVIFTAGGTEANNLAIRGFARAKSGDRLINSVAEHPSTSRAIDVAAAEVGVDAIAVPVDSDGVLDLDHLEDSLTPKTRLVALIHVQNETGVVQPVAAAAAIVRDRAPRAHLHVDAVQSFGKVKIADVVAVADSIAVSSHKIHGPKGVGALILFTNASPRPLIAGGGQEDDLRSGTENVPGIVGFSVAAARAAAAVVADHARITALAERVRHALLAVPDVSILAEGACRSPFVTAAVVGGVRGETLQHQLEKHGVILGTGSACHAARGEVSASLRALGLDHDQARSVIRVSLSHATDESDVARFAHEYERAVLALRELVS